MLKTKIISGIICLIITGSACSKKVVPGATSQQNSGSEKSTETKPAAAGPSTGKATEGKAGMQGNAPAVPSTPPQPAQPKSDVPQKGSGLELGSAIYTTKCARCHAPKSVSAYTYNQWEGILKKMVPNAKLDSEEENNLREYIKANAK